MNFATAFEFPDTSDMLGIGALRSGAVVSPIAPHSPAAAAVQFDLLDDAFCLSRESSVAGDDTIADLKATNAALTAALHHEKESAVATEAELERLRDHATRIEEEFERVRDRAMDLILSRTAEVDRLKKQVARLTAERDLWQARHAAVSESAERLRKERDGQRRPLRADAPEFVPAHMVGNAPSFEQAVRARLLAVRSALPDDY